MSGSGPINVLGVKVSSQNLPTAIEQVERWIGQHERHYICVCNVHGIMECQRSEQLRQVFNRASMVAPDGMPLVWLLRAAGRHSSTRVYGPDLLFEVLRRTSGNGHTHYFFGGTPEVLRRLRCNIEQRFPTVRIAGGVAPPVASAEQLATDDIADEINRANPDLVWVGLGCPKQELWMAAMRPKLHAPVLIGIGAAFDFYAGSLRQAPRWMMAAGLEWLFRLAIEPRRLWRRYLVYNPWFVWSLLLQKVGLREYTIETS